MAGLNCGLKECEAMYTRCLLHRENKRFFLKKELLLVSLELRETISKNGLHFFKRKNQNNKELFGNKNMTVGKIQ